MHGQVLEARGLGKSFFGFPALAEALDAVLTAHSAMPDAHSTRFGGADLPGFPQLWIDRKMP
jgi:ribose transport system substrate-binding protein